MRERGTKWVRDGGRERERRNKTSNRNWGERGTEERERKGNKEREREYKRATKDERKKDTEREKGKITTLIKATGEKMKREKRI